VSALRQADDLPEVRGRFLWRAGNHHLPDLRRAAVWSEQSTSCDVPWFCGQDHPSGRGSGRITLASANEACAKEAEEMTCPCH
jgi:hypothetical protein